MKRVVLSASIALAVACGPSDPGGVVPTIDAPPDTGMLPTWQLEDVNPQSPRSGQTYGVDTFVGRIVVVTLLEGF